MIHFLVHDEYDSAGVGRIDLCVLLAKQAVLASLGIK